jgi:hypothetical protein
MDPMVGQVLWVVAALLMAAGIAGVALAVLVGKPSFPPDEIGHPAAVAVKADRPPPAEPVAEQILPGRKAAYRRGFFVFVGLAVLTVAEFFVASAAGGSAALLFILALAKAGVIIQYYMHLNRLWGDEEAH